MLFFFKKNNIENDNIFLIKISFIYVKAIWKKDIFIHLYFLLIKISFIYVKAFFLFISINIFLFIYNFYLEI